MATITALPGSRRTRTRPVAALTAVVLAVLIAVFVSAAQAPIARATDTPTAPSSVPLDGAPPSTDVTQSATNTPQPVGQTLPSKTQRGADSLVAILLLITLAGALVAVATSSRWNRGARVRRPQEAG